MSKCIFSQVLAGLLPLTTFSHLALESCGPHSTGLLFIPPPPLREKTQQTQKGGQKGKTLSRIVLWDMQTHEGAATKCKARWRLQLPKTHRTVERAEGFIHHCAVHWRFRKRLRRGPFCFPYQHCWAGTELSQDRLTTIPHTYTFSPIACSLLDSDLGHHRLCELSL